MFIQILHNIGRRVRWSVALWSVGPRGSLMSVPSPRAGVCVCVCLRCVLARGALLVPGPLVRVCGPLVSLGPLVLSTAAGKTVQRFYLSTDALEHSVKERRA